MLLRRFSTTIITTTIVITTARECAITIITFRISSWCHVCITTIITGPGTTTTTGRDTTTIIEDYAG